MADRRMLWKSVSQSRKVNSLSDEAVILWTWAIPWFDRDGYMEAEADFLKCNLVPRRKSIPEEKIPYLVEEIVNTGLWISFIDDEGKLVVKEKEFRTHQSLEYKKEIKSKWEGKDLKESSPRRVLGDNAQMPLHEGKVREGKVREGKSLVESSANNPVNNLKDELPKSAFYNPPNQKSEEQKKELQSLAQKINTMFPNFRLNLFLQNHNQAHPEAILHTLRQLLEYSGKIGDVTSPMALCESIIKIENQNYNARDFYEKDNKTKIIFSGLLNDIQKLHRKDLK